MGLTKWKLPEIVSSLPLVLHLSLGMFAVGLVLFVYPRNIVISGVLVFIFSIAALAYVVSAALPAFFRECPYRIPLLERPAHHLAFGIRYLRYLVQRTKHVGQRMMSKVWVVRRGYLAVLTRLHPDPPRYSSQSLQSAEFTKALSSQKNLGTAVSWLHETSSNPTVRRVAAYAVAGLLPGLDATWKDSQAILDESDLLGALLSCTIYDTIWEAIEKERLVFPLDLSLALHPTSVAYNGWVRAEVLLRSLEDSSQLKPEWGIPPDRIPENRALPLLDASRRNVSTLVQYVVACNAVWDWDEQKWDSHPLDKHFHDPDGDVGQTALHYVAANGNTALVEWLLDHDFNIDVHNNADHTPLRLACQFGHLDVVKLLVHRGAEVHVKDTQSGSVFNVACRHSHFSIAKWMLKELPDLQPYLGMEATNEERMQESRSPLFYASQAGDVELVKLLLTRGADPILAAGWVGSQLWGTPLHAACSEGHLEVATILLDGQNPVDMNVPGGWRDNGGTPLCVASVKGHLELVRLLLKKGADATIVDRDGDRPLDAAIRRGQSDIAQVLRSHEADHSI